VPATRAPPQSGSILGLPGEVELPNLKLYRITVLLAIVFTFLALFTLGTPDTPRLTGEPVAFDAQRCFADLRALVTGYTGRIAGSDADQRATLWLIAALKQIGFAPHVEQFTAAINGRTVTLQNVWVEAPGDVANAIVVIANRDSPPGAIQGANNNASGVAVALETARAISAVAHRHTIVFLFTDGDAYGALGASDFMKRHDATGISAAIALRKVGLKDATGLALDGSSAVDRVAPPWTWILASQVGHLVGGLSVPLPRFPEQILRLAVPFSSDSQGPFVAAGVPAVTLSASGPAPEIEFDTLDTISTETLTRVGGAVQSMVLALDAAPDTGLRSGDTIFLTRHRQLPGATLVLIIAVLLLPLTATTVDLLARGRRRHQRLGPAWARWVMHLAPLLFVLTIVYVAGLMNLFPRIPGAVIPPDAGFSHHPRYLRVIVLVVLLLLAYRYAVAVERHLARRVPTSAEAATTVAHTVLLAVALLMFLANPFSVILLLPAALLWPLARPGHWASSLLLVWCGLGGVAAALVFFALRLHLGIDVWWYFLLLFENRSVPVSLALLGVAFVATSGMLAASLHGAVSPASAGQAPGPGSPLPGPGASEPPAADPGAGGPATSRHQGH